MKGLSPCAGYSLCEWLMFLQRRYNQSRQYLSHSLRCCTKHQGCMSFCLTPHARCCLQPAHTFTSGSGKISAASKSDLNTSSPTLHQKIGQTLLHKAVLPENSDLRRLLQGIWHLDAQVCFHNGNWYRCGMVLLISLGDLSAFGSPLNMHAPPACLQ